MRTEVRGTSLELHLRRSRRETSRACRTLEPQAVDAAMEDDSTVAGEARDGELLESLSKQLDALHEQEQQIRRLLARAGYVRIDGANA